MPDATRAGSPAAVSPSAPAVAAGATPRLLHAFDLALEVGCVLLLLTTVVVTLTQVFFRYVLNASLSWPEELARWAFVWMVFVGMALVLARRAHVAIDLVARLLPERLRRVHALITQSVVAATSLALLVHGLDLAGQASYVSPALEWHFFYLYLAVPTGAVLNLFYLVRTPVLGLPRLLGAVLPVVLGGLVYGTIRAGGATAWGSLDASAVLLASAFGVILLGVPVGFGLAFGAVVALSPQGELMMLTVSQNLTSSLDSFILLAIPFFILSGGIMNVSGITRHLIALATTLVGHLRGGLGQVNIVTSVMMGGLTGSSMADAAATSKTVVPAMEERGYDRTFSCAVTSASSVLANLIPPSLSLILYGALASASVGALFIATIIPGFLVAGALMAVVFVISLRRGYGRDVQRASRRERLAALWRALPALLLPVGVVGGVRIGAFTATEAGAIAVLYGLLIGVVFYRQMASGDLVASIRESFIDTVAVMFIVAAASPFAWVLVTQQVPQTLAGALGRFAAEPLLLLMMINVFLLLVGLVMELVAAMVILVPILIPLVTTAGIDPVHFGIVLVINLVTGALTPPMGMLVFTTARVARASVAGVFYQTLPFVVGILVVLLLVSYVPALTLLLPSLVGP